MADRHPSPSRWRVTAKGHDGDPSMELESKEYQRREIAAHRMMDKLAPESAFGTERRPNGASGDDVLAELTVEADGADTAEAMARSLLGQVLPSIAFAEYVVEPDSTDRVHRYPGTCSFCGRGRDEVKKLVAFPGAAIWRRVCADGS